MRIRQAKPYLVAFLSVGVSFILKLYLHPMAPGGIHFFYVAIIVAAGYGGMGAGVFATLFVSVLQLYYFIPPSNSFELFDSEDALRFSAFLIVSIFACFLTAKLYHAREKVNELMKEKERFIATLSHEIKTPLNAIIGLSGALLGTQQTQENKKFISTIHHSSQLLTKLLETILDFSKLSQQKESLQLSVFSLRNELEEIQILFSKKLEEKGLRFEIQIDEIHSDSFIRADILKLKQVVFNLLSNAIKFTEKGKITLEASLFTLEASSQARLEIRISDTGTGIPKDFIEKVFEPFFQVENPQDRLFSGSGLGLAITRSLIEVMKGEIKLESEIGVGTQVKFTLPVGLADAIEAEVKTEPSPLTLPQFTLPTVNRRKILIIEDDETNQIVTARALESFGYETEIFDFAADLEMKLLKRKWDAILLDCHMPKKNGMQYASEIRKFEKNNDLEPLPLIAVSADTSAENQLRCHQVGMNGFLAKPLDAEAIRNLLKKWIKQPSLDHVHLDRLQKIETETGSPLIEPVLQIFLKNTPIRIETILNLSPFFKKQALKSEAHLLKSASNALGALRLAQLCEQIEEGSTLASRELKTEFSLFSEAIKNRDRSKPRSHTC